MTELGVLAEQIIEDELSFLEEPEKSLAISRASGWLTNNLGKLNTRIYSNFSGENPGMKYEEASIYKNIYMSNYYRSKANSVLKNMDAANLEWLFLKEGDSQIQLQNKNEVAKTYIQLSKEKETETKDLISAYNLYEAYPRQISIDYYSDIPSNFESSFFSQEYESMGSIEIQQGSKEVFVPLDLDKTPERISISLIKPSNNSTYPNFSYSVVGQSISQTGFLASLGATVNYSGYKINYGVK